MMMMHTQSPIRNKLFYVLLTSAGLAIVGDAFAAEHRAVAPTTETPVQGDAGMGAGGEKMGEEGRLNQNAPMMQDSSRGMDRARERMNEMGSEHEPVTEKETTSKPSDKAKAKKKAKPSGY